MPYIVHPTCHIQFHGSFTQFIFDHFRLNCAPFKDAHRQCPLRIPANKPSQFQLISCGFFSSEPINLMSKSNGSNFSWTFRPFVLVVFLMTAGHEKRLILESSSRTFSFSFQYFDDKNCFLQVLSFTYPIIIEEIFFTNPYLSDV